MIEVKLAKIRSVKLGSGGYDGAMFGISFDLGGDGWCIGDFWGNWSSYPKGAKYSEEDWAKHHTNAYLRLQKIMKEARVDYLDALNGKPVEVTIENNTLKSWRILTEVL